MAMPCPKGEKNTFMGRKQRIPFAAVAQGVSSKITTLIALYVLGKSLGQFFKLAFVQCLETSIGRQVHDGVEAIVIGNDAISPAVFAAAMKYVRIRALGMPAAAVIGSYLVLFFPINNL